MRDLGQRMHPGIGAPGAEHGDASRRRTGDRGFQRLLDRQPVRLALPADEAGAAIFDRQLVAGHGSTVPGGSAKPRRKAGRVERARGPARCSRSGRNTPSPQATDRRSSSTVPGGAGGGLAGRLRRRAPGCARRALENRRRATGRRRAPGAPARPPAGASRAGPRRGAASRRRSTPSPAAAARASVPRATPSSASTISRAPSAARRSAELRRRSSSGRSASPPAAASGRCRAPRPSA